ncbi:cuticle protein CP575 [Hyalella azteca]|uniref:Cuticle protein CP575 n=1 Tax=Hyalella azteca TaxID=294128 RepID=A0A8B7PK98_HYAAZ|nr:cuticle protein CP575 [Hyalella azteca]
MKFKCTLLLALTLVSAAPAKDIIDYETKQGEHEQEGTAGKAVEGEYSWVSPDGTEYYVKYVADHLGYRVVESDVVHKAVQKASQG